jgi:exo-beta-1,3-glucanase (GH17 family)
MKFGAWIHEHDLALDEQILAARQSGLRSIRSYSFDYSRRVVPALKQQGMSLLAGMHIEAESLVADWRQQVNFEELAEITKLDVELEGICVGNELREGGDAADRKRFTARLSFGLANVLNTYRHWLDEHGVSVPLTYAMEGIVFDQYGTFHEWIWPLIDACDIVSINLYPMDVPAWFTFGAFDESRKFLTDRWVRNDRLNLFELQLRQVLTQLEHADKPMMFSETGFPSAIGYQIEDKSLVIPQNDNDLYGAAMGEFMTRIRTVNADFNGRIKSLYFYEWRDNLYHSKIWNIEQSPIHVAFGLCDRFGIPKFDIRKLLAEDNP